MTATDTVRAPRRRRRPVEAPMTASERQARQRDRYHRMQQALQKIMVEVDDPTARRIAHEGLTGETLIR